MKKNYLKKLLLLGMVGLLTACGSGKDNSTKGKKKNVVLTVLTCKTDLNSTVFPEYAKRFKSTHPEVKDIIFEAPGDYANVVKTRMSTKDYGDVLMIPAPIINENLSNFFAPLGKKEDLEKEYKSLSKIKDGKVYGIPCNINAAGTYIYNKDVFKKAGITSLPKNPEEFYNALAKIKAIGVTPLYTNYAAKWSFAQWDDIALNMAANRQYKLDLINDPAPFKPGKPYYELFKVMYEVAKRGYTEKDPITSDWESSKQMVADGKVGLVVLASWAYPQITALTDKKDSIGIAMFPLPAKDGNNYLSVAGDYNLGVNIHSKNKEVAKEFIDFFVKESGYVKNYGVISPYKKAENPKFVEELLSSASGHILEEKYSTRVDDERKLKEIEDNSGIDIVNSYDFKQEIIDAGMQGKSFEAIMHDLNKRWSKEVAKLN